MNFVGSGVLKGAGRGRPIPQQQPMTSPQQITPIGQYHFDWRTLWHVPAYNRKDDILRHIQSRPVSLITGDTGCGKSSLIPFFLTSSSSGQRQRIWVLQPTRIACRSLATRVANMLGTTVVGNRVGYAVAGESVYNPKSEIIYCTSGYAFRYFAAGIGLTTSPAPTHIVFDEAHNRELETDLLMAWLRQRSFQGKTIVMSATLDVAPFVQYYKCDEHKDVLHIDGKAYSTQVSFLNNITFSWITPRTLARCAQSNRTYTYTCNVAEVEIVKHVLVDWIARCQTQGKSENVLIFLSGLADIMTYQESIRVIVEKQATYCTIVTLHSQLLIDTPYTNLFVGDSAQKCNIILATNVAESSLTIPNVGLVIDFGVEKCLSDFADSRKQLMQQWCSKSSVIQRRGRAGRTQDGYVLHMYPDSLYESTCPPHSIPECQRVGKHWSLLQTIQLFPETENLPKIQKFLGTALIDSLPEKDLRDSLEEVCAKGLAKRNHTDSVVLTQLGVMAQSMPMSLQLTTFLSLTIHMNMLAVGVLIAAFLSSSLLDIFRSASDAASDVVVGLQTAQEAFFDSNETTSSSASDLMMYYQVFRTWLSNRNVSFMKQYNVTARKVHIIETQLSYLVDKLRQHFMGDRVTHDVHLQQLDSIVDLLSAKLNFRSREALVAQLFPAQEIENSLMMCLIAAFGSNPSHVFVGLSTFAMRAVVPHRGTMKTLSLNGFDPSRVAVCTLEGPPCFVPNEDHLHGNILTRLPHTVHTQVEKFGMYCDNRTTTKYRAFIQFATSTPHHTNMEAMVGKHTNNNNNYTPMHVPTWNDKITNHFVKHDHVALSPIRQASPGVRMFHQLSHLRVLTMKCSGVMKQPSTITSPPSESEDSDPSVTISEPMISPKVIAEVENDTVGGVEKTSSSTSTTTESSPDSVAAEGKLEAGGGDAVDCERIVRITNVTAPFSIRWRLPLSSSPHGKITTKSLSSLVVDLRETTTPHLALVTSSIQIGADVFLGSGVWVLPQSLLALCSLTLSWTGSVALLVDSTMGKCRGVMFCGSGASFVAPINLHSPDTIRALCGLRMSYQKCPGDARHFISLQAVLQKHPAATSPLSSSDGEDWRWCGSEDCLAPSSTCPIPHVLLLEERLMSPILLTLSDAVTSKRSAELFVSHFLVRLKARVTPVLPFEDWLQHVHSQTSSVSAGSSMLGSLQFLLIQAFGCSFSAPLVGCGEENNKSSSITTSATGDPVIYLPCVVPSIGTKWWK
eukprot:PhF_6_TR8332/c0_g1_i2/m.13011/K13185/DHX30; ATP-dependent RNA helicase DHX30